MSDFIEYDSEAIYNDVILMLENGVTETLYPGDERRIFGESLVPIIVGLYAKVNDTAKQRLLRYARGEILDAIGDTYRPAVPRLEARKSITTLKFTAKNVSTTNIIIPQGTRATADGFIFFETDSTEVLQAGSLSIEIPATSTAGGHDTEGFQAGDVNVLVDAINGIDSVTNLIVTSGGDDGEPYTLIGDDDYRERIRNAPNVASTAGHEEGYRYYAKLADSDIGSVDVDSPSPTVVVITPLMKDGSIPDQAVLNAVLASAGAKDVRPMTDQVIVQAPTQVPYDIEFKYYTTVTSESEAIVNIEGAGGAIEQFINWQDKTLGRDINPDQLRRFVLDPRNEDGNILQGALRLDVIKPNFTILGRTSVAHFSGNLIVSHDVVTE